MRFGIVVFPGSNCEQDVAHACRFLGYDYTYIWHQDTDLSGVDAVVLPGGFSYGDYLRCGAVARFSPVMGAVIEFAQAGRPVLGICNGFQILTEAHLLPGALLRNQGLKFICREVPLRVESYCDWLGLETGSVIKLPINHNDGNFVCDEKTLAELHEDNRIVLRYCNEDGSDIAEAPNGALDNIAGICNAERNVFGLMPHPERAVDSIYGSGDGQAFFTAVLAQMEEVGA